MQQTTREFYAEHKELIDKHILPFICNGVYLSGGPPTYMYQQWTYFLAREIQEKRMVTPFSPRYPLYKPEITEDGHEYTDWNWRRMDRAFTLLGKKILRIMYCQTGEHGNYFHFPIDKPTTH